jgi:hypothetical protein
LVVLGDLVGDVADAGVGDRELGKLAVARRFDDRPAGGSDQLVDAGLAVAVGDALGGAGARHELGDLAVDGLVGRLGESGIGSHGSACG